MTEYIDFNEEITQELFKCMRLGPIIKIVEEKGKEEFLRDLKEKKYDTICGKIKVLIFSKEREPAHFLIQKAGEECRFSIETGEPLDQMPKELGRFSRNIKKWYIKNRNALIVFYNDNLPDDAPPTARIN